MNILTTIIIIAINFVLQATILNNVQIFGVVANTTLVLLVYFSLLKGTYYGGILGLIVGLLQDIIFSSVIGVNALIYFLIGYFVGILEKNLSKENIIIPLLATFISTFLYNLMYYIIMFFLSRQVELLPMIRSVVFLEALYNTFFMMLLYRPMSKIFINKSMKFRRRR